MKVYLAGSMQNAPKGFQVWRTKAKSYLDHMGFRWFDPYEYYNYEDNYAKTEKEILQFELRQLSKCDIVLVNLNNITKSVGTIQEVMYAYCHNIPIMGFYEYDDEEVAYSLNDLIHPWLYEECERIEYGYSWSKTTPLMKILTHINSHYGADL